MKAKQVIPPLFQLVELSTASFYVQKFVGEKKKPDIIVFAMTRLSSCFYGKHNDMQVSSSIFTMSFVNPE